MTTRTPERIAVDCAADWIEEGGMRDTDYRLALMAVQEATREAQPAPEFQSEGTPDKYRDLWAENMPRVSGRMYFAIPGEQPIHVSDDQARRILQMLSADSEG